MDEKGLGRRLQQARASSGLTQQALCHKANLSYSTLTKIERGAIKAPSIFTIQSIATALGLSLDELMGATRAMQQRKTHRSKSGIRFVYFDINGCLVRFYQRAFTELAEATDVSADIIETTFWHYNDQVCRGDMSLDQFNEVFAKALGIPSVNWTEYYLAAIDPIPVMQELVEWAAAHYRVGLLTNIMPGFITAMQGRKLIPGVRYDVVIDSSEVHAIKPEAKIYELATKKAGCKPEEILFIDDSRTNLMAAEKQGWRVLWFDDYQPEQAVVRIREALELADD